jgi:hypothetical protein
MSIMKYTLTKSKYVRCDGQTYQLRRYYQCVDSIVFLYWSLWVNSFVHDVAGVGAADEYHEIVSSYGVSLKWLEWYFF